MANNRVVSIFLLVFCGFFYYQTTLLETKNLTGLSAAFFPRVLLGIIAILSVIMLVKSFFTPAHEKVTQTGNERGEDDKRGWIVWVLFALFAVYVFLIKLLGFVISSFLFMTVVYMLVLRQKRSVKKHLLALGGLLIVAIAVSTFFENVLQVFLPRGIIF